MSLQGGFALWRLSETAIIADSYIPDTMRTPRLRRVDAVFPVCEEDLTRHSLGADRRDLFVNARIPDLQ